MRHTAIHRVSVTFWHVYFDPAHIKSSLRSVGTASRRTPRSMFSFIVRFYAAPAVSCSLRLTCLPPRRIVTSCLLLFCHSMGLRPLFASLVWHSSFVLIVLLGVWLSVYCIDFSLNLNVLYRLLPWIFERKHSLGM